MTQAHAQPGAVWIPRVRSNWRVRRVRDVVTLVNGYPFDASGFNTTSGTRVVRIRDILSPDSITYYAGSDEGRARIDDGDLLIGMDGDFNTALWTYGPAILNQRMCCLRPSHGTDIRFIAYVLCEPLRIVNTLTYYTTVKHLSSKQVLDIRFADPGPKEQRRIADFLDRKTAAIDALIDKKERLLALLQEKRQALITELTTHQRGGSQVSKDGGIHWLHDLPTGWRVVPSTWLFSESKTRASEDDQQLSATQAYGVIPQAEFERREGRQVVHLFKHLDLRKRVELNDFIVSMRSFQGGLEIAHAAGAIRSSYVVLKPSKAVHPPFFAHLFKSQSYIQALRATSNFIRDGQDLNFRNFRQVPLPLVPFEEQVRVANEIQERWGSSERLWQRLESSVDRLREYRQALITAAVTGQLDVTSEQA